MKVKEVYMFAQELVERMKDGEIDHDQAILEMSNEFAIEERFIVQILDQETYEYVL